MCKSNVRAIHLCERQLLKHHNRQCNAASLNKSIVPVHNLQATCSRHWGTRLPKCCAQSCQFFRGTSVTLLKYSCKHRPQQMVHRWEGRCETLRCNSIGPMLVPLFRRANAQSMQYMLKCAISTAASRLPQKPQAPKDGLCVSAMLCSESCPMLLHRMCLKGTATIFPNHYSKTTCSYARPATDTQAAPPPYCNPVT